MDLFSAASSHKVSANKTKILFSKNVSLGLAQSLSSGLAVTKDFGKYLGVPVLHQRITKQTYRFIIESMQQKLATRKAENLSLAGRIALCKPILARSSSFVSDAVSFTPEVHLQ